MELPITHGFSSERHLVRYNLAIYKKPGDYRSKKPRLVHGVEETENQTLKISVAWEIKRLVKKLMTYFTNTNLDANTRPASVILFSNKLTLTVSSLLRLQAS
jgi:hypothetical protein